MDRIKGQITVFIALLFQVLFVFFAMLINVGMTVHDKINLQNSVDLAAYYGAQKQAEILNVIAHVNYQIRQDWKLLAWRMRAFGDSSRSGHPALRGNYTFNQKDSAWPPAIAGKGKLSGVSICMTVASWNFTNAAPGENICANGGNINIPKIPDLAFTFFPWDFATKDLLKDLQDQFLNTCRGNGVYNWYMAIRWMAAYRMQIGRRQEFINLMAERLKNFQDIDGNSIEEGMRRTLRANLTKANLESLASSDGYFKVLNSMEGIQTEDWLPNIKVFPYLMYTDLFGTGGNCGGEVKHISDPPREGGTYNSEELFKFITEPVEHNSTYHSTKGREKNPWYMVYVGLKVQTAPRKPFFPFGDPVKLVARSFAKPFGGRIGPWTKNVWLRQTGWAQDGNDIDPNLPPRFVDKQSAKITANSVPNYSRFPGDTLGLTSRPTLSMANIEIKNRADRNLDAYAHLPQEALSDPLAKPVKNQPVLRNIEIAAIAPDIFDTTYYSIQPEFYNTYLMRILKSGLTEEQLPHDLGSAPGVPFSVKSQIEVANDLKAFKKAYFKLSSWEHLLSAWVSQATMDYSFPTSRFGICHSPPTAVPTDSYCVGGGRAGYSVKTVAKSYLNSNQHNLGGGDQQAPLLNPPGDF